MPGSPCRSRRSGYPPFDGNYIKGVLGSLDASRFRLIDLLERTGVCRTDEADKWHQDWDQLPGALERARPWIEDER